MFFSAGKIKREEMLWSFEEGGWGRGAGGLPAHCWPLELCRSKLMWMMSSHMVRNQWISINRGRFTEERIIPGTKHCAKIMWFTSVGNWLSSLLYRNAYTTRNNPTSILDFRALPCTIPSSSSGSQTLA